MKKTNKTKSDIEMHTWSWGSCCGTRRFPTFAIFILIIGIFWLLNDLEVITIGIPWVPVILIVLALGWIINSYSRKSNL